MQTVMAQNRPLKCVHGVWLTLMEHPLHEGCLLTGCFLADQIQQQCGAGAAAPRFLLAPQDSQLGGVGSSQHRDPAVLTSCGLLSPVNFEPSRQGEAETGSDSSQIGNLPSLM